MPWIRTRDGTDIYVKDWGSGRPVILIQGYPLNFDSFDRTAMHLAEAGFRVINYDRRGFGRSGQPWGGHDWDTDSDDLADVMQAAGATQDVTVIGYSIGGGECARYMSPHGGNCVIKIGLYASVMPGMLKADDRLGAGRALLCGTPGRLFGQQCGLQEGDVVRERSGRAGHSGIQT